MTKKKQQATKQPATSDDQEPERAKILVILPNCREEMQQWPRLTKSQVGYELWKVQNGEPPTDFKTFSEVGKGAFELRHSDEDSKQYRIFYVACFAEAIYVFHVIAGKKTQKTSQKDKDTAKARYKALLEMRKEQESNKKSEGEKTSRKR